MAYDLTLDHGTSAFTTGKSGQGLSGGVYKQTGISAPFTGGVTYEAWVKTTGTSTLVSFGIGSGWVGISSGSGFATVGLLTGGVLTASSTAIRDGLFHHLAWTNDGTNTKLWVDGSLALTAADAGFGANGTLTTNTGNPLVIGGLGGTATYDWSVGAGVTDLVRLSSGLRYTATFTPPTSYTDDANTIALYSLDSVVTDSHVTGVSVPGAPTALAATAGNTQAALTWTAPASNGGAAITDYIVQSSPDGGTTWSIFTHTASTALAQTVTGLTNGTAYTFRVAAVNSAGTGSYSATTTTTPVAGGTNIAPNDANIVYSPYNWNVTAGVATTTCPGAYLRTTVTGTPTAITANFDMTNVTGYAPQVAITVDNEPVYLVQIAATLTIPIPASTSNTWTKHAVEIVFKQANQTDPRWTAPLVGVIKFTGFTVAPSGVTTTTTRRRKLNVLCYGDSITEGILTRGANNADSRLGWAFPLRDLLGAEVGVVGYGATGLTVAGNGGVPALTTSYASIYSGTARSFTTPAEPDLIVINEGTNDGGDVTTAASTVLNGLLSATVTSKIAVVQQWNGTAHKTQWQAAIAACAAPSRVTYIDTSSWLATADTTDGTHPWGYINLSDLSPRLAVSLRAILGAGKQFLNVGGVATPLAATVA